MMDRCKEIIAILWILLVYVAFLIGFPILAYLLFGWWGLAVVLCLYMTIWSFNQI
jgi:hypothetical protein